MRYGAVWSFQCVNNALFSHQTVPHGVLCFLSSYRMLDKLITRWQVSKRNAVTYCGDTIEERNVHHTTNQPSGGIGKNYFLGSLDTETDNWTVS